MKNPGIAAVLCFFYTGLGQIYNGQILKGLVLLGVRLFSDLILCALLIGFVTSPLIWIFAMYDAYKTADRMNR